MDSCGASDAFFATFVRVYAYKNVIDEDFITNTFIQANMASRDVISKLGSRRK